MSRNDITGNTIANTKGSAEKYAQGWERLFAKKVEKEADKVWHMANGSSITFKDSGAEPLVGLSSSVVALDFHDSTEATWDTLKPLNDLALSFMHEGYTAEEYLEWIGEQSR